MMFWLGFSFALLLVSLVVTVRNILVGGAVARSVSLVGGLAALFGIAMVSRVVFS